jgi:hypothetical protein
MAFGLSLLLACVAGTAGAAAEIALGPVVRCAVDSEVYPDLSCTPGVLNDNVVQDTTTICNQPAGWTKKIRPTSSVWENLKTESMREYGLEGKAGEYEFDHLIPLQLGGDPSKHDNLWPEAYGNPERPGAREKDSIEGWLRDRVCQDQPTWTLVDAQTAVKTCWLPLWQAVRGPKLSPPPKVGRSGARGADCVPFLQKI